MSNATGQAAPSTRAPVALDHRLHPHVQRLAHAGRPRQAHPRGVPAPPSQVEWLIATAILSGSLGRLNFGIWADRYGGRVVYTLMLLACAVPTYLFTWATTYNELFVYALLFGVTGNSFSAGVAWVSAWYPSGSKGFALGVFGAGNVGASGTKLLLVLCRRS